MPPRENNHRRRVATRPTRTEAHLEDRNDVLEDLRRWLGGAEQDRHFLMREIDIEFVRRAAWEIERLRRERVSHEARLSVLPGDDRKAANDP